MLLFVLLLSRVWIELGGECDEAEEEEENVEAEKRQKSRLCD